MHQSSPADSTDRLRRTLSTLTNFDQLNPDQQRAVALVLAAKDYALIVGLPGTGKTTTVAYLVWVLSLMGKSVLLTAHTHTAVDNILLKLIAYGAPFLRLGRRSSVHPLIHPYLFNVDGSVKNVTAIRGVFSLRHFCPPILANPHTHAAELEKHKIFATTCLGTNHALLANRIFDFAIVDEASQVTQPICLGPLRLANTFVLVGDHQQLPPLVRSMDARKAGMEESLFQRLHQRHPQASVNLTYQYRMNQDIMSLSNKLVYNGLLRCGSPIVASVGRM